MATNKKRVMQKACRNFNCRMCSGMSQVSSLSASDALILRIPPVTLQSVDRQGSIHRRQPRLSFAKISPRMTNRVSTVAVRLKSFKVYLRHRRETLSCHEAAIVRERADCPKPNPIQRDNKLASLYIAAGSNVALHIQNYSAGKLYPIIYEY